MTKNVFKLNTKIIKTYSNFQLRQFKTYEHILGSRKDSKGLFFKCSSRKNMRNEQSRKIFCKIMMISVIQ